MLKLLINGYGTKVDFGYRIFSNTTNLKISKIRAGQMDTVAKIEK